MRILFVAMAASVHTARWISQVVGRGWDVHLFPTGDEGTHKDLHDITLEHVSTWRAPGLASSVHVRGQWPFPHGSVVLRAAGHLFPSVTDRASRLARVIRRLRPDVVHSLEIQHAGYLTLAARDLYKGKFPPWIVTNWGSDIYLFGRLPDHADRIRAVLSACDYYACECPRDVALGRQFGFQGQVLPVLPNTGGLDIGHLSALRRPGPVSARRLIALKGYQHWAGRALVGLRAVELCADVLRDYRVAIYLANKDVTLAAELVTHATGIPIDIIPRSPHEDMLRLHGRARVSIGLSISDSVSTSFLETIAMGSFPIQSNTACVEDWVRDGETAFLVPPEDPEVVTAALRRALTDDELVDRAAETNERTVRKHLDRSAIESEVVATYEGIRQEPGI